MRIMAAISLVSLGLAVAPEAPAQEGMRWVEGHVFNKWTGVPLQNVVIQVGPFRPPQPGPGGGVPRDYTDANGFYSVQFFQGQPQEVTLTAACFMPPKKGELPHLQVETQVRLREGTLRRDLYIAGPRNRLFDYCQPIQFPR